MVERLRNQTEHSEALQLRAASGSCSPPMAAGKEGESSVSEVHGLVLKGRHWNHGDDAAVGRETAKADREEKK